LSGEGTRVISHRPLSPASPDAPLFAPPEPFKPQTAPSVAAAPDPGPSAAGYAVRLASVYPSQGAAQQAVLAVEVAIPKFDFVRQPTGWAVQLGTFKDLAGAKELFRKLAEHNTRAEIVSLDQVA